MSEQAPQPIPEEQLPDAAPKPLSKSLTVRASVAQAIVPVLAYWLSTKLGLNQEDALVVAGSIFALLASIVSIGMRRALGSIALLMLVACSNCNHKLLEDSAERYVNGPGKEWVEASRDEKQRKDRENRNKAFKAVIAASREQK